MGENDLLLEEILSVIGNEASENDKTSPTVTGTIDSGNPRNSLQKNNDKPKSSAKQIKLVRLPLSRIKHIMKMDPEVHLASSESVFLITKATELFIETLTKEAYSYTASAKKKTIQRGHVDSAVANAEALCFLEGALDF